MMEINEIKELIEKINKQIKPLLKEKERLNANLRKEESLAFIRANNITKNDVQRCDDKDMPWLGDVCKFGEWLKMNSSKKWCCWNNSLYLASEIIAGRMARKAPGSYEDLTI